MAVKRRTVWIDDREWERMGVLAQDKGLSISRLIGTELGSMDRLTDGEAWEAAAALNGMTVPEYKASFADFKRSELNAARRIGLSDMEIAEKRPELAKALTAQQKRDAILRRIDKGG